MAAAISTASSSSAQQQYEAEVEPAAPDLTPACTCLSCPIHQHTGHDIGVQSDPVFDLKPKAVPRATQVGVKVKDRMSQYDRSIAQCSKVTQTEIKSVKEKACCTSTDDPGDHIYSKIVTSTPKKRKLFDSESASTIANILPDFLDQSFDSSFSTTIEDENDSDYVPEKNDEEYIDHEDMETEHTSSSTHAKKRFLVYENELMKLLTFCPDCGAVVVTKTSSIEGSLLKVQYSCLSNHDGIWYSQPLLDKMAAGNLLLTCATVLTGRTYCDLSEMAEVLEMPILSESHFYHLQSEYVFPVINTEYNIHSEAVLSDLQDSPISVVGDGRFDSPGFSAKYCTYSIMDARSGLVTGFSLMHVGQSTSSVAMEKDGCRESLQLILDHDVSIKALGTDRNAQITKLMREEFPKIEHQYDVYHMDKNIRKRIGKHARSKVGGDLTPWMKSISYHLWYSVRHCNGDGILLQEMMQSTIYHITNKHEWYGVGMEKYHACAHAPLDESAARSKKWLIPDSTAHQALRKILFDKKLSKDMRKLSHGLHTGELESYHSLLTKYVPKRQHFSYKGMMARTQLTILDHNLNIGREHATTSGGEKRFNTTFSKSTKEWVAKPILEKKDHSWRKEIAAHIIQYRKGERTADDIIVPKLPRNIARKEKPSKAELVARHESRF